MTNFTFKTIPNFSSYVVNADGQLFKRVITKQSLQFVPLDNSIRYNGYIQNKLKDDSGVWHQIQRGRLMLMAYAKDSYFDGAECDHINHDLTNNHIENLRWVTHSDNCKNRRASVKHKSKAFYLYYDDGSVYLYTQRKFANIPTTTMSKLLRGKHSKKYKCRAFYFDELHKQPKEVRENVRSQIINDIDSFLF